VIAPPSKSAAVAKTVARNNAIQLAVKIKSDLPGMVYSSRLMIAWKSS